MLKLSLDAHRLGQPADDIYITNQSGQQTLVVQDLQRVGRSNPSLASLSKIRAALVPQQSRIMTGIEHYYSNSDHGQTNVSLLSNSENVAAGEATAVEPNADKATARAEPFMTLARMQGRPQRERYATTLRRRASFLLNSEVLGTLPELIRECRNAVRSGSHSTSRMLLSAAVTSIKSHAEHVGTTAVLDAQNGVRICPLPLKTALFDQFLEQNTALISQIIAIGEAANSSHLTTLQPQLEQFTKNYLAFASALPDTALQTLAPEDITLSMNKNIESCYSINADYIKVHVSLDYPAIEAYFAPPLPEQEHDLAQQELVNCSLLQGFEQQPPVQRRAALTVQMLLAELAVIEERIATEITTTGTWRTSAAPVGSAARNAAEKTLAEWRYTGAPEAGDYLGPQIASENRPEHATPELHIPNQRRVATQGLFRLRELDRDFEKIHGESLFFDPKIRSWIHSPALHDDVHMLQDPGCRLLRQQAGSNARALLRMPCFAAAETCDSWIRNKTRAQS